MPRVANPRQTLWALNCHHYLSSAERRVLQPSDCVYSESMTPQGKLVACRRDLTEILVCKYAPVFLFLTQSQFLTEAKDADGGFKANLSNT